MENYLNTEIETEEVIDFKFSFLALLSLIAFFASLIFTSGAFRIFISFQILSLGFISVSFGVSAGWNNYLHENGMANMKPIINSRKSSVFVLIFQFISLIPLISIIMGPHFWFVFVLISSAGTSLALASIYIWILTYLSGLNKDYIEVEEDIYGYEDEDLIMAFTEKEYEDYVKRITQSAQDSS